MAVERPAALRPRHGGRPRAPDSRPLERDGHRDPVVAHEDRRPAAAGHRVVPRPRLPPAGARRRSWPGSAGLPVPAPDRGRARRVVPRVAVPRDALRRGRHPRPRIGVRPVADRRTARRPASGPDRDDRHAGRHPPRRLGGARRSHRTCGAARRPCPTRSRGGGPVPRLGRRRRTPPAVRRDARLVRVDVPDADRSPVAALGRPPPREPHLRPGPRRRSRSSTGSWPPSVRPRWTSAGTSASNGSCAR